MRKEIRNTLGSSYWMISNIKSTEYNVTIKMTYVLHKLEIMCKLQYETLKPITCVHDYF